MVTWHFDDNRAAKKWRAAGYEEKDRKPLKRPSKTAVRKSHSTAFQTACFAFIQSDEIALFQSKLPGALNSDRLFAILLLEALWKVLALCVKFSVAELPEALLPQVPMLQLESSSGTRRQACSTVDEDSEIHRFVGSGIKTLRETINNSKKRIEKRIKANLGSDKAKTNRLKRLKLEEAKFKLLTSMRRLKKDLPVQRHKSYDSKYLQTLDGAVLC
jgi:hypothetical protein